MTPAITSSIPEPLMPTIERGCPAILLSLDPAGYPHTAFTWVAAVDNQNLRFAVDHGGVTIENLRRNPQTSLQIMAEGNLLYLIKGCARQGKEQISAVSFSIALWSLKVSEVKDQSWSHATVAPLTYRWTHGDAQAMEEIEVEVYRELRQWSPD